MAPLKAQRLLIDIDCFSTHHTVTKMKHRLKKEHLWNTVVWTNAIKAPFHESAKRPPSCLQNCVTHRLSWVPLLVRLFWDRQRTAERRESTGDHCLTEFSYAKWNSRNLGLVLYGQANDSFGIRMALHFANLWRPFFLPIGPFQVDLFPRTGTAWATQA